MCSLVFEGEMNMSNGQKLANEIGALRLMIVTIEYQLATNKAQVDEVVGLISDELGADKYGLMKSLQTTLDQLKKKQAVLLKRYEPQQIKYTLDKMVDSSLMTKVGDGYALTVLGEVYAKHSIKNNPDVQAMYRDLILKNGGDPDADELLASENGG